MKKIMIQFLSLILLFQSTHIIASYIDSAVNNLQQLFFNQNHIINRLDTYIQDMSQAYPSEISFTIDTTQHDSYMQEIEHIIHSLELTNELMNMNNYADIHYKSFHKSLAMQLNKLNRLSKLICRNSCITRPDLFFHISEESHINHMKMMDRVNYRLLKEVAHFIGWNIRFGNEAIILAHSFNHLIKQAPEPEQVHLEAEFKRLFEPLVKNICIEQLIAQ